MTAVVLAAPGPVFIDPNQQTVQSNATVTASGSSTFTGFGTREISLIINIKNAPTGTTPTLTYTLQELDPGDQTTSVGTSVTGAALNSVTTQILTLSLTLTGVVKVSWAISGAGASFTGVYATLATKTGSPQSGLDSGGVERTLLVDTSGRPNVVGAAATGAAVAGNPLYTAGLDSAGLVRPLGSVTDRTSMTAGTQTGVPFIGQSFGVGRIARVSRMGTMVPGYQTLLAADVIEGSTINSWLWTQSATTMTISQTTGTLTLNANATTTTGTDAIVTTTKQFGWFGQTSIGCSFKAEVTQTTNAVNELGFGAPTGTTATINNGAFFRINASGTILAVISTNGTETVSASLGTIVGTTFYLFYVWIEDGRARFVIESSTGVPLVDYTAQVPLGTADVLSAVSHIPAFARVYTSGTAGSAPTTKIAGFQAWQFDTNSSQPYSEQLSLAGRNSNVSPTAFTQTLQLAAGAAPTAITPNNTGSTEYTTLGGEFDITMTASSENFLGVFAFTVPSPYTLNITEIFIAPPAVTTVFGATATVQEWSLMVANSGNPSTATGFRYPLGVFGAASAATVGTVFNGQPINRNLTSAIAVLPGQVVLIMVKNVVAAASGAYRGICHINGYYS